MPRDCRTSSSDLPVSKWVLRTRSTCPSWFARCQSAPTTNEYCRPSLERHEPRKAKMLNVCNCFCLEARQILWPTGSAYLPTKSLARKQSSRRENDYCTQSSFNQTTAG